MLFRPGIIKVAKGNAIAGSGQVDLGSGQTTSCQIKTRKLRPDEKSIRKALPKYPCILLIKKN